MTGMDRVQTLHQQIEAEPLPANLGTLLDQAITRFAERPAWIAMEDTGPDLTYRELGALVARTANAFHSLGVRKGAHVGIMLPNVPQFLAGWLALARLGALMVPINPSYTPDELHYMLSDGDAEFLLIDRARLANLQEIADRPEVPPPATVMVWGGAADGGYHDWSKMLAAASDQFTASDPVALDDIVNIQYTSGSTGFPKGCLLSHRYWLTMGKVKSAVWPTFERIQCDLPFYYMGPLWRFSVAAFQGAALCVPPAYSLTRFVERLRRYRIDFGWMTDPVGMLPETPEEGDNNLKLIAIFGMSQPLRLAVARRFKVPVRDSYGMTEIGSGLYVPMDAEDVAGTASCGIPAPFRRCMIADDTGKPVKQGEVGELCVSGPGILQGYYKKPQATEKAFWNATWFRTGDLFRQDEDGCFYIVGRIKDMIRRSAENISAIEVEAALSAMPQIQEAAVIGVKDAKRGEEVKACIVLKPEWTPQTATPQMVVEHCRQHLAKFKLPRYVQFYLELPKTGSNKIAKKQLTDGGGQPQTETFDIAEGAWH
jgi:acyl-coenzyme A synthetase/AMP-(fatty) acid ligase